MTFGQRPAGSGKSVSDRRVVGQYAAVDREAGGDERFSEQQRPNEREGKQADDLAAGIAGDEHQRRLACAFRNGADPCRAMEWR